MNQQKKRKKGKRGDVDPKHKEEKTMLLLLAIAAKKCIAETIDEKI
jgi:hypothetical protein